MPVVRGGVLLRGVTRGTHAPPHPNKPGVRRLQCERGTGGCCTAPPLCTASHRNQRQASQLRAADTGRAGKHGERAEGPRGNTGRCCLMYWDEAGSAGSAPWPTHIPLIMVSRDAAMCVGSREHTWHVPGWGRWSLRGRAIAAAAPLHDGGGWSCVVSGRNFDKVRGAGSSIVPGVPQCGPGRWYRASCCQCRVQGWKCCTTSSAQCEAVLYCIPSAAILRTRGYSTVQGYHTHTQCC